MNMIQIVLVMIVETIGWTYPSGKSSLAIRSGGRQGELMVSFDLSGAPPVIEGAILVR